MVEDKTLERCGILALPGQFRLINQIENELNFLFMDWLRHLKERQYTLLLLSYTFEGKGFEL